MEKNHSLKKCSQKRLNKRNNKVLKLKQKVQSNMESKPLYWWQKPGLCTRHITDTSTNQWKTFESASVRETTPVGVGENINVFFCCIIFQRGEVKPDAAWGGNKSIIGGQEDLDNDQQE